MCGIAGLAYFPRSAARRQELDGVLRAMVASIRHRGPDESGYVIEGNVLLGMARLAINGLADGSQPMIHKPTGVIIVCNGELYDFRQHREELEREGHKFVTGSDTEVLLHLYVRHGMDFANRIDAEFACAILDPRVNTLFLIRDRFGVRPLYYYRDNTKFVFGSEIKAILGHPDVPREIDHHTLLCNLMRVDLLSRSTFANIHIVRPGHYLAVNLDGGIAERRYWDFAEFALNVEPAKDSFADAAIRSRELLRNAVRRRVDADVRVGCFLSGGLDSSLVTALMAEFATPSTFSIEFADKRYDEGRYSRAVAAHWATDHHALRVDLAEQCAVFPRALFHCEHFVQQIDGTAKLLLAEHASAHVKAVLVGEGADEIFLGYPSHLASHRINDRSTFDTTTVASRQTARHGIDYVANDNRDITGSLRKYGYYPMQADAIAGILPAALNVLAPELREQVARLDFLDEFVNEFNAPAGLSGLQREQAAGVQLTMPVYLFEFLGGKLEMAASLEGRLPFLDRDVVEYALSLPTEYHLRDGKEKSVLRAGAEGLLLTSVLDRPKHGFSSSIADGFTSGHVEYFEHYTSPRICAERGLFDASAVAELKTVISADYDLADQEQTMRERVLVFALSVHLIDEMFIRRDVPTPLRGSP